MRSPLHNIASRIALASLLVTSAALVVIAVGVLAVSQSQFQQLMVEHGSTAAAAHAIFDQTVTAVFVVVLAVAGVLSVALAVLLARRLSRPLEAIGRAARTVAAGEYRARVPRTGPEEIISLADSFNQMAESLEEQERIRRDLIINAAHELRTPLTNLPGYLDALRDGVIAPDRQVSPLCTRKPTGLCVSPARRTRRGRARQTGCRPDGTRPVGSARLVCRDWRAASDRRGIRLELRTPGAIARPGKPRPRGADPGQPAPERGPGHAPRRRSNGPRGGPPNRCAHQRDQHRGRHSRPGPAPCVSSVSIGSRSRAIERGAELGSGLPSSRSWSKGQVDMSAPNQSRA